MTLKEFSNEFDVLYNNIMSNAAPGLNEYEKSVFLTQAQEELVVNLYSGRVPQYGSFEETEELRKYLDTLLVTSSLLPTTGSTLSAGNLVVTLPSNLLFIVYEKAIIDSQDYKVTPVTHDEYKFMRENPFRGRLSGRVLRLDNNGNQIELCPPEGLTITSYFLRYLKVPNPIILVDLSTIGASIKGITAPTNCELHQATHIHILKLAVQKAAIAYKS